MRFIRASILAATLNLFPIRFAYGQAKPITETSGEAGYAKLSDLVVIFANITAIIATFAGFAVLFMFIRAGISFMTAQGDPKALQSARGTLTYAVIGLIVILSAYIIISVVVGFVSVPGVGRFCLPTAGSDAATYCQTDQ